MNAEQIKIAEHRATEHAPEPDMICEGCGKKHNHYIEVNWPNQKWYGAEFCRQCYIDMDIDPENP